MRSVVSPLGMVRTLFVDAASESSCGDAGFSPTSTLFEVAVVTMHRRLL